MNGRLGPTFYRNTRGPVSPRPEIASRRDAATWALLILALAVTGVGGAQPPDAPVPQPSRVTAVITNSIGMKLALIPAGEFLMGSPESDQDASADEKPQHQVQISKPFYLGVTEVTQEQYERVMGQNWSSFKGDPQRPVEMVSWEDAVAFCKKLSEKEGQLYRLPTEAEWEYACRAGSKTKWSFGDDDSALGEYAWYGDNAGSTTHPVAQRKPNAWGLYDMQGNAWEWCQDWYGEKYYAECGGKVVADPGGPGQGVYRVLRGGSWIFYGQDCRPGYRGGRSGPGFRFLHAGFRLALGRSNERAQ